MILGHLGVPDEEIVADYVITEQCRADRDAFLAEHDPDYLSYLQSLPDFARETKPESMRVFLEEVRRRHGSMSGYLAAVGLEASVAHGLRRALVTGP